MMSRYCWILWLSLLSFSSYAAIDVYQFDSDAQQQRYRVLIEELRCPKCQNQNLAGSDAPIAQDLRRELHRLILEGQNDQAILDFMVQRYGNFVLYRPPLDKNTVLLWSAPLILLLLGLLIVWRVRLGSKGQHISGALTVAEQQQLDALLRDYR